MAYKIKKNISKIKFWHLILLYFLINLFFLQNFPFVHSDEAWLSGLSRQILETKNLASTESFFDLLPRHPHAVKIFFHLLQIIFIKIFDYQLFTFRLISLLAGSFSLYFFYKIIFLITKSEIKSLAALLIMMLDLHFIYSSHLARQEIILILIFLAAFNYLLKNISTFENSRFSSSNYHRSVSKDIILGLITATAIGFHPNAFIIALPFILIYSWELIVTKDIGLKNYLAFGSTLALIALIFVYLSFRMDPNFISNYSSYGAGLGVLDSFMTKLENFKYFYQKLFYRISGTYYIPPIKFQLSFFSFIFIISVIKSFFQKNKINLYLILSIAALNLGYLIIGRYNQTSIIFIFPICYILFFNLIKDFSPKFSAIFIIILTIILSFNTASAVVEDSHYNYQNYLDQIAEVVEKDAKVLANLNADYYFENGSLYDYRNLAYLEENNLSFAEYIAKNEIKYIIYPEEMDFIYNTRPTWNILYGNLYPYYSEMQQFLNKECELIKEFESPSYGIRIVNQIEKKDWTVKIYQLN